MFPHVIGYTIMEPRYKQIEAIAQARPALSAREIAEAVGTTRAYVNVVRSRMRRGKSHEWFGPGIVNKSVIFDDDMRERISARAAKHKTSFAEQVRLLVEWGLEADE